MKRLTLPCTSLKRRHFRKSVGSFHSRQDGTMSRVPSQLTARLAAGIDGWHTDGSATGGHWRWEASGASWGGYLKWHPAVRLRVLPECLALRRRFRSGSRSPLSMDHQYMWWTNVHCDLRLPFVCQRDADSIGMQFVLPMRHKNSSSLTGNYRAKMLGRKRAGGG